MRYGSTHALTNQIINSTKPDDTNNPEVQGNWPQDSVLAVCYSTIDKQFPSVQHAKVTIYFTSTDESEKWFAAKREWIKGTDFDFSISCDLYAWDLGPEFVGTLTY